MTRLTVEVYGSVYPAVWEICDRCRGNGYHGNPAFDGLPASGGMEDNPFDDYEFVDDYLAGRYDVTCEECRGSGKILVVDEELLTSEQFREYKAAIEDEYEYRAMAEMERRMGC